MRVYENGWLLEIQEPTVIRDAAVLMALNSALEPEGSINLPTRIVRRHPDFIAVITTNRGYNGCLPLNEALRDRVQHSEKMDLPPIEVMMERAMEKTGFRGVELVNRRNPRQAVKGSLHEKEGMIVHRPESTPDQRREYQKFSKKRPPTALRGRKCRCTLIWIGRNRL